MASAGRVGGGGTGRAGRPGRPSGYRRTRARGPRNFRPSRMAASGSRGRGSRPAASTAPTRVSTAKPPQVVLRHAVPVASEPAFGGDRVPAVASNRSRSRPAEYGGPSNRRPPRLEFAGPPVALAGQGLGLGRDFDSSARPVPISPRVGRCPPQRRVAGRQLAVLKYPTQGMPRRPRGVTRLPRAFDSSLWQAKQLYSASSGRGASAASPDRQQLGRSPGGGVWPISQARASKSGPYPSPVPPVDRGVVIAGVLECQPRMPGRDQVVVHFRFASPTWHEAHNVVGTEVLRRVEPVPFGLLARDRERNSVGSASSASARRPVTASQPTRGDQWLAR